MKATELKTGQNYKIGTGTYTYRGLLDEKKGMTKTNKLVFWLRENDENSPVIETLGIRVDLFNNEMAKNTIAI